MQVLRSEELSLLVSSYLPLHSCWSLRRVSQHTLSPRAARGAHRALGWRQELSNSFALLEVALSLRSQSLVSVEDVRSFLAATGCVQDADERLGQLHALAGEMVVLRHLHGSSELALGQQCEDGELRAPSILELCARFARFESSLAEITDDLACGRVPCKPLSLPRPSGRRLSRHCSVIVPKGEEARLRELCEGAKKYQTAKAAEAECEKWLSIVNAAESARVLLQECFARQVSVSVTDVMKALGRDESGRRCKLRPRFKNVLKDGNLLTARGKRSKRQPLPMDLVPAALGLLIARTCGGLELAQPRLCFKSFHGDSSFTAQIGLREDLVVAKLRRRQVCSDVKGAFVAMLPGPGALEAAGSDSSHSDGEFELCISEGSAEEV